MRRTLAILLAVAAAVVAAWLMFRPHASSTQNLSDLPPHERQEIEQACLKVVSLLRDGQLDDLWQIIHPTLRNSISKEQLLRVLQDQSARLPDDSGLKIESGWRLVRRGGRNAPGSFTCGPIRPDAPGHYRVGVSAGICDMALCFVSVASRPISRTAVVLLAKHEGTFRLAQIAVSDTSYHGRGAEYYESLGRTWHAEKKDLPAYLAFSVAAHLRSFGSWVVTGEALSLKRELDTLRLREKLPSQWNVGGADYQLVSIGIITTLTDISPHVRYITHGDLVQAQVEPEAALLLEHVKATYPDLATEFDAMLFQAHDRMPQKGQKWVGWEVPLSF